MREVLPATWRVEEGSVRIGEVPLDVLADERGTPLVVIDERHVRERMRRFREAFGPEARLVYAGKAFLCGALVRLLAEAGWWLDAVSDGELELARRAGFDLRRVVLHGNAKTAADLRAAVRGPVGRIVIDHPGEVEALAREVREAVAGPLPVLLRLNLDVGPETHDKVKTVGTRAHFGMDRESAVAAAARVARSEGLSLAGGHVHVGSQIYDLDVFRRAAAAMVDVLERLLERCSGPPELDLGGGLAAPYLRDDAVPSPEAWAEAVRGALAESRAAERLGDFRLFVEPGRSVIANAGVTLYRVQARKRSAGLGSVIAVDGGLSDNPRPSLYGARHEVLNASRPDASHDTAFRVVGRHCETGDVLAEAARLPGSTAPGDLLVLPATGAYVFPMSSRYNGIPRPAVVFVGDGTSREVVRRESYDDLFACDRVLEASSAADAPAPAAG